MHLWPTKSLRDSFKISYIKNLQWNYKRMENESSTQHKLLEEDNNNVDTPKPSQTGVITSICHEVLLLLSCCYCCFCCGACVEGN